MNFNKKLIWFHISSILKKEKVSRTRLNFLSLHQILQFSSTTFFGKFILDSLFIDIYVPRTPQRTIYQIILLNIYERATSNCEIYPGSPACFIELEPLGKKKLKINL
jgi:hypothetical protein